MNGHDLCRVRTSASTYWAAEKQTEIRRLVWSDEALKKEILRVWKVPGRGLYGARKVWGHLNREAVGRGPGAR